MAIHHIDLSKGGDAGEWAEVLFSGFEGGLILGFLGTVGSVDAAGRIFGDASGELDDFIQVSIDDYQHERYFTLFPRSRFEAPVRGRSSNVRIRYQVQEGGIAEIHTFKAGENPIHPL